MIENSTHYRARNPFVPATNPTSVPLVSADASAPALVPIDLPPQTAEQLAAVFLKKSPGVRQAELQKLKTSQPGMYDQVYAILRKGVGDQTNKETEQSSAPAVKSQPKAAEQAVVGKAAQKAAETITPKAEEQAVEKKVEDKPADAEMLRKLAQSAGVRDQASV